MLHNTNLEFNGKLDSLNYVTEIILHHTEVSTPHTVQDVHKWHQKKQWAGIGYHFFIDKNGEIYTGRPLNAVGAHTLGHNKNSIGVCFEGDFNREKMTDKQLDGSVMLLSLLLLAYDAGLCKGCDLSNHTDSPGKNFPFEKLLGKIEECKKLLRSLFGEQYIIYDDRSSSGSFEYSQIIDLFEEIVEPEEGE